MTTPSWTQENAPTQPAAPTPPAATDDLRIRLLGGFHVSCSERVVEDGQWRLSKARGLVKLLALSAGHQLHREQVIDYLWPDLTPDAATNNLHQVLFAVRRTLAGVIGPAASPAQVVTIQRQILRLSPPVPLWIDALVFEGLVDAALRSSDPADAYLSIDLYAGDLLPEDRYEPWADEPRERLRERYLAVLLHLARLHEERDELAPAIDVLRRLIAADPTQELAHIGLMRLYALTGRAQQALRQYQRLRDILEREIDALPSREADRLYAAIVDNRFPAARPKVTAPLVAPAARESAAPPTPAAPPASDFVNRERELEMLQSAFDGALSGQGTVVLLGGDPGIGKTRAVEEFGQRARATGARVLWGRCYEGEGSLAYWPWVQILRADLRERDVEQVADEMGTVIADIARLVPDLRERLPDLPAPIPLDPDQERFRLFESITVYLTRVAEQQPLLLAFDDLHWADRSSLHLLEFLADEIRDHPVLVVGSYRDSGLDRHHPLTRTLNRLARYDPGHRLHLDGLSVEHVAQMSATTSGRPPPPGLIQAIHEQTEGNPFFVREVVRLLIDEGRFDEPENGRAWRISIPQGVRETIELRLDRLSDDAIHVLEIAAVIGRDFDLAVLERVSSLTGAAVIDVLEQSLDAGVLTESQGRPGAFRFAHALIQQTLYEDVSAARRVGLHRQIGRALETEYASDLAPHLADLAFHYAQAARGGGAGDIELALEYATLAGAQAMDQVAYVDAVSHFERALQLLDAQRVFDGLRRCELVLYLGEALAATGDSEAAKATFHLAVEIARRAEQPLLLARAAHGIAEAMWKIGLPDQPGLTALAEAVEVLASDESLARVQALADLVRELATATEYIPGVQERAGLLSDEAMLVAMRLGDTRSRLAASIARRWIMSSSNDLSDRIASGTEILELARSVGDRHLILLAHAWRIFDLMVIGDMTAVDAENDAYEAVALEIRQSHNLWAVLARRGMRALMQGRIADAERLIEATRALNPRLVQQQIDVYAVQISQLRREQGRCEEVLSLASDVVSHYASRSHYGCMRMILQCECGHIKAASASFEHYAADDFGHLPRDLRWVSSLALLSDVCVMLRDGARAATLYTQLLPYDGFNVSDGGNVSCFGPVSLYLGNLAVLREDWHTAERHYVDAIAMCGRMDAPLFGVHAEAAFASMLLQRGSTGDIEWAKNLMERALAIAEAFGMTRAQTHIQQLRRQM